MARMTGRSETWQVRISPETATQLREDAAFLGQEARTAILRAALDLLHRHAKEERMARIVDGFYGEEPPPPPIGVLPASSRRERRTHHSPL